MFDKGIFTVSIDLEIAWGICDKPLQQENIHALEKERDIIKRLLSLFEKYDLRATWGVVGHLLLNQATWENGKPHPHFPRPVVNNEEQDWFFQLPQEGSNPLWYGRDVLEWLRQASPEQEIGSHSFCHLPYDEKITNREAISADLATVAALHGTDNLPFASFIFPRNVVGFRDLLYKTGMRVYRGKTSQWYDVLPVNAVRRMLNLLYFIMAVTPPTVLPKVDEHGLVDVPDSMLLFGRNGWRKLVSTTSLKKMGILGLQLAARRKRIFHFWFHPSNFAYQTEEQFDVLETIIQEAKRLRNENKLIVKTMGEYCDFTMTNKNRKQTE